MSEYHSGFATQLRRLRLERGISLAELARQVHYTKGHMSKVENEAVRPNAAMVRRCDEVLDAGGALIALFSDQSQEPGATSAHPAWAPPPPATEHFHGREHELARLASWIAADSPECSAAACVIWGMAGVGKTSLASTAAHRAQARFADGCLFIDLHGYDDAEAVSPGEAADRLLRSLGEPGTRIPPHGEDRTVLLRQRLATRELLLILDNAAETAQVAPLLPAASGVRVIVTSRSAMPALDEIPRIALPPLSRYDSMLLLRSLGAPGERSGRAVAASPGDLDRIARWCGGLPLALRIAAARLGADDGTGVEMWAEARHRLEELDDGERAVAGAFHGSFGRLGEKGRRFFALCGLHPGADFDAWSASAIAGTELRSARRLLQSLGHAGLLLPPNGGRFAFHDLVRLFARRCAQESLTTDERRAARNRLVDHYLASVESADRVLTPYRHRIHPPSPGPQPHRELDDHDQALAWLTAELDTLVKVTELAHASGLDTQCWRLAFALRGFLFIAKPWAAWLRTHEAALAAALRDGAATAEATTRNNLGLVLLERGDLDAAEAHYLQARELFARLDDPHGEHTSIAHLAWVYFHRGDRRAALRESTRALRFFAAEGKERNRAIAQRDTASIELALGDHRRAAEHLRGALETFSALGLHVDAVMALIALGQAYQGLGLHELAQKELERAVDLAQSRGIRFEQARAHEQLAEVAVARDRPLDARMHRESAERLYRALPERPVRTPSATEDRGDPCQAKPEDTTSSSATPGRTSALRTPSSPGSAANA